MVIFLIVQMENNHLRLQGFSFNQIKEIEL